MLTADTERFNQAILFAQSGQREKARAIIVQLLRSEPNDPNLLLWLAFTSNKLEQARLALSKVRVIDPANPSLPDAESWLLQQEAQTQNIFSSTLPIIPTPNPTASFRVSSRNSDYQAQDSSEDYWQQTLLGTHPSLDANRAYSSPIKEEANYPQGSTGYVGRIAQGWQLLKQAWKVSKHKHDSPS
ncbi:MAG: hypothetical protein WCS37_15070 [Chloroflexota bacterium]|nr:hypothetical protein [Chloroflexota bacterium]